MLISMALLRIAFGLCLPSYYVAPFELFFLIYVYLAIDRRLITNQREELE
jgi:hypothetical protein